MYFGVLSVRRGQSVHIYNGMVCHHWYRKGVRICRGLRVRVSAKSRIVAVQMLALLVDY